MQNLHLQLQLQQVNKPMSILGVFSALSQVIHTLEIKWKSLRLNGFQSFVFGSQIVWM